MKENKLLVLGTLVVTFALYFITYSTAEDQSEFNKLSLVDKTLFYNDLE